MSIQGDDQHDSGNAEYVWLGQGHGIACLHLFLACLIAYWRACSTHLRWIAYELMHLFLPFACIATRAGTATMTNAKRMTLTLTVSLSSCRRYVCSVQPRSTRLSLTGNLSMAAFPLFPSVFLSFFAVSLSLFLAHTYPTHIFCIFFFWSQCLFFCISTCGATS